MTTAGFRWIALPLAAALCMAAASRSLSGMESPGTEPPVPAAELFLGRLQAALSRFSETPIRTRTSGQTVFFESTELTTGAGNLTFAGRFVRDPAGRAFDGVLERFSLCGGRIQVDLKHTARIHCAPDGTLSIEDFEAGGPQGRIAVEGSITRAGKFDGVLRLAAADLRAFSPFWALAPIGILDAELTLRGDWGNPIADDGLTVDIHLSAGRIRTELAIPPIEALELKARLNRRGLEIRSCEGLSGGAPFRVTGRIENPADLPENGRVDLELHGDNLLIYRSEEIRLRAATALRMTGPYSRFEITGTLAVTDGRYEKNFELIESVRGVAPKSAASRVELFAIRSQPFRDAVFDVAVTAIKPFEIRNSRVRAAARPDLRLTGTGEKPVLTGRVSFEPSTLYLPGGRMHVEAGVLRFQPPDRDRPSLEISGHGRLQGYDVTAVVAGAYDQPMVTLSSSPALPNEELLLLVLSGQTPKTRREMDSERSRNLNVAVFLGKDLMARIEGNTPDDTTQSILDRFDVDVGRSLTRSGDETLRVLFRVANGVFREGDTLSLAGEKDAYGYYNGGVRIAFRFR